MSDSNLDKRSLDGEYMVTATLHCASCGRTTTVDTMAFRNGEMEPVLCENGHFPEAMLAIYINLQHQTSPKMFLRRKNAQAR